MSKLKATLKRSNDKKTNAVKEEAVQQTAFEEAMSKLKATLKRLNDKKTNTRENMAANEQSSDETADAKDLKTDDEEYLSQIEPDCTWMLTNFDARKSARAQEMDGLKEAEGALNGAVGLTQVSSRHQAFLKRNF